MMIEPGTFRVVPAWCGVCCFRSVSAGNFGLLLNENHSQTQKIVVPAGHREIAVQSGM